MGAVLVVIAGLADAAFRWPVVANHVTPTNWKQTSLLGATAIAASGRRDVSAFVRIAARRRASGASRTRGAVAPRPRPRTQLRRAAALRVLCNPSPRTRRSGRCRRSRQTRRACSSRSLSTKARFSARKPRRWTGSTPFLTTCGCSTAPTVGWPLSSPSPSRARRSASSSAVTGDSASWDVPMHTVSRDPVLIERLVALGFHPGLQPPRGPPLVPCMP